jgi:hypothetical protein
LPFTPNRRDPRPDNAEQSHSPEILPGDAHERARGAGRAAAIVYVLRRSTATGLQFHRGRPQSAMERARMKSCYRYCVVAALLALATPAITTHAAAPTAGTSNASNGDDIYPYQLPLTFEITHGDGHELGSVRELMITVQRDGQAGDMTILSPVNPFTPDNQCTRPMPAGITACVVNTDRSVGTVRVDWTVPQPGSYRIVVSAKRGTPDRETLVVFTLETVT